MVDSEGKEKIEKGDESKEGGGQKTISEEKPNPPWKSRTGERRKNAKGQKSFLEHQPPDAAFSRTVGGPSRENQKKPPWKY